MMLFDLPMQTTEQRRNYHNFRKWLLQKGYLFFQESVYVLLLRNISSARAELRALKAQVPREDTVHALPMNLNVFKTISALHGKAFNVQWFSDDILYLDRNNNNNQMDDSEAVPESPDAEKPEEDEWFF